MTPLRLPVLLAGVAVVLATLLSAVRTFVVPRATPVLLTRAVFRASRRLFLLRADRLATYEDRDRLMANYAPLTLIALPVVWLLVVTGAFSAIYWSLGVDSVRESIQISGSSLLTLGFDHPPDLPTTFAAFGEATIGLGLLALLLSYLPTMYTAFSRREAAVAMIEVRAGSPPTPAELFTRAWRIQWMERLPELWESWQGWFIDVEETHTSLAALSFFRSPQPQRSWVVAAGCVLDAASMRASVFDLPKEPDAELCVRTGFLALRRIADYFGIEYDPDPSPGDAITVTREEFDAVLDRLQAEGLPVKADRDEAWRAWSGWRVNYDALVITLAAMTMAPLAPWTSDRGSVWRPGPIRARRRKAT